MIHGALHGAELKGVEPGEDLAAQGAVVLHEDQVGQLDQEQHGKGGHLDVGITKWSLFHSPMFQ